MGCGTGLVGIVTAMTTAAAAVTLTDFDPTVLEVAAENLALNVPQAADEPSPHAVKKLDWFDIVRQLRHHFGPSLRVFGALYHPTHAMYCVLLGYLSYWMLIGACDPML